MRGLGVLLALVVASGVLVPYSARAGVVTTLRFCTGDGYVNTYRMADGETWNITDAFYLEARVFCTEAGRSYTIDVRGLDGSISGTGECAGGTGSGDIEVRGDVRLTVMEAGKKPRSVVRSLGGRSEAPIPGGSISGRVGAPGAGGVPELGRFRIEPFESYYDCYRSFQILRFYDLMIGPSPGA
jgi:hypothetical protein